MGCGRILNFVPSLLILSDAVLEIVVGKLGLQSIVESSKADQGKCKYALTHP